MTDRWVSEAPRFFVSPKANFQCAAEKEQTDLGQEDRRETPLPQPFTMLLVQLFLELPHMPLCGQQFGNSDPKI